MNFKTLFLLYIVLIFLLSDGGRFRHGIEYPHGKIAISIFEFSVSFSSILFCFQAMILMFKWHMHEKHSGLTVSFVYFLDKVLPTILKVCILVPLSYVLYHAALVIPVEGNSYHQVNSWVLIFFAIFHTLIQIYDGAWTFVTFYPVGSPPPEPIRSDAEAPLMAYRNIDNQRDAPKKKTGCRSCGYEFHFNLPASFHEQPWDIARNFVLVVVAIIVGSCAYHYQAYYDAIFSIVMTGILVGEIFPWKLLKCW